MKNCAISSFCCGRNLCASVPLISAMSKNICRACSAYLAADGDCVACALEAALLVAPAPSASAGLEFAGCTLRREIVAGGMGVVYEAWQPALNRTVALKMMRGASSSRVPTTQPTTTVIGSRASQPVSSRLLYTAKP